MINSILTYILHIAPSLAVVVFLLIAQNQRMGKMESEIQAMLLTCLNEVFNHLNNDK